MRNLLLFIGSCLYPLVMVIISPVLLFVYSLLGAVMLTRYVNSKTGGLTSFFGGIKLPVFHFLNKKHLVLRPKAVRLH